MKLLIFLLAVVMSGVVMAKTPTYKEARAIYDAMGKTIDDAGIWYEKKHVARAVLTREAAGLVKKSEQVFGADPLASPYRQCLRAVILHQEYVAGLNTLADTVQGITAAPDQFKLFSSFPNAARFGDARAWCFNEIEQLR